MFCHTIIAISIDSVMMNVVAALTICILVATVIAQEEPLTLKYASLVSNLDI